MLSCGKVIGQLPKLTRYAPVNLIHRPLKHPGIITVSHLWYSKKVDNKNTQKPIGTTVSPEECTTEKRRYSKPERIAPLCESRPNGSCPPSCHEACGIPPYGSEQKSGNGSGFRITNIPYWEIWGTLIVTGVLLGIDAIVDQLSGDKSDSQSDVNSKKDGTGRRYRRSYTTVKNPPESSLIPQEVPYLLIGGGTAAFSAFRSIKSRDPKAKVLVITEEEDFPYMRPPLSKELWYNTDRVTTAQLFFKQWNGKQRSIFYEPQEFYINVNNLIESDKGGVAVATGWKVTKLDVVNKTAILDDGYELKYDKCLLATGASPKTLPAFESLGDNVRDKISTFRTKEDFLELESRLHDPTCKDIVIIGGGFLGSELACALARNHKEKKIYQVFKEKYIMGQVLPEYLSKWTTNKVMLEGVRPIPNAEIQSYKYSNGKISLTLTDNRIVEADQVVVAVGVEANTKLAAPSNLETHSEVGGYVVNAELEARSNVWVAGDAACFYDIKLGRRRVEHHDHAVVSGRLAGENMTGAGKPYVHQSMFWSDLGPEVGYEAVGIIDSSLSTVGVFAEPTHFDTDDKSITATSDKQIGSSNSVAQDSAKSDASVLHRNPSSEKTNSKENDKPTEKVSAKERQHNEFEKGVVFYLRDDVVVGIILWNIFNRMPIARQVLARGSKSEDLNEIAKLFTIHDD